MGNPAHIPVALLNRAFGLTFLLPHHAEELARLAKR
jgi:hypothetical protein